MATGHAVQIPHSLLDPVRTLTATIAAELGEAVEGGDHYRVLFVIGLVLFAVTFVVNLVADLVVKGIRSERRDLILPTVTGSTSSLATAFRDERFDTLAAALRRMAAAALARRCRRCCRCGNERRRPRRSACRSPAFGRASRSRRTTSPGDVSTSSRTAARRAATALSCSPGTNGRWRPRS